MSNEGAQDDALRARVIGGADGIDSATWNRLSQIESGSDRNPFIDHGFFLALEQSGSASAKTGWQPQHLIVEQADGAVRGIMPLYLKSHSQGEYVFDHGWADALERAGGRYYPKLQSSVPFTPATAPKLWARADDLNARAALIAAAEALATQNGISSIHATFLPPDEVALFEAQDWLIRTDTQFHWDNQGFGSFGDFLDTLASRKRKTLRKERDAALAGGIEIEWLSGDALTEAHWDAFFAFYMDTGSRKWGRPYLNRDFFSRLSAALGERIVLMLAQRDGRYIAGALNLKSDDTLFGRYWGAIEQVPFLHFELCYYQAIDYAIAHGLKRVEAGAQGEHKLARGYAPTPTHSAHFIVQPGFRKAVADYLAHERQAVARDQQILSGYTPFKKG